MDRPASPDPADAVNAFAAEQGWPFRASSVLAFERPELNQLRDLWHEKAAGRPMPHRSDFDLRSLKPVLPNIVILQRVHDSDRWRYRIRLMGSELVRLMGEGTGRFLDQAIAPESLPRWLAVYEAVRRGPGSAALPVAVRSAAHRLSRQRKPAGAHAGCRRKADHASELRLFSEQGDTHPWSDTAGPEGRRPLPLPPVNPIRTA